jgi:pSer/pThr/pTyr-binding forkhead associated (FHA) protein
MNTLQQPIGVLFGGNHDHEKHTGAFSPAFRAMGSERDVLVVVAPETQLDEKGSWSVHRLAVVGGKTVAQAVEEEFTPDQFAVLLDRTGTLKKDYDAPVVNDRRVRQIGQGKEGDRVQIASDLDIPYDFDASGRSGFHSEIRVYTHISREFLEVSGVQLVATDEKTTFNPLDDEYIHSLGNSESRIVDMSIAMTRAIMEQAGVGHAFSAASWKNRSGFWVMTAPNTGNVQFGTTKKETHPDAYVTRQNLGKHMSHIANLVDPVVA